MKKFCVVAIVVISYSISAFAQQPPITAADYARAEKMLGFATAPFVDRAGARPTFLPDGRFWYRVLTATGSEYVLINPVDGTRKAGATMADIGVTAPAGGGGRFAGGNAVRSPDGKKEVFIKDWNLWVRDIESKKETQLTTDGIKDFGYATDNAGWTHSDRAILLWSPDSRKIATFQQDQRHVSDMYLVTTNVGAPKLEAWKYPLPQDTEIIKIHRVIIEVDTAKMIRLKAAPDDRRSTLCDDISCAGSFDDNEWSADAKTLAFVSTSRDHKAAKLRIADAATGQVREVMEEVVATQYESGQGAVNWKFLPATKEVIWYSERDDWGHLYLYDLTTGKLKNQITKGNFVVTRLLKMDEAARVLYFEANGREPGRDPYFTHFYRINFDGTGLALLTPEDGNHQVTISPDGKYFVDNFSKVDVPNVAVLRDMTGKLIANLEKAEISRLATTGWKPAKPVTVRSADGKWDLYGVMFTPTNLDPKKKYPVINYIYPGPQGGGVGPRSFNASRSDHQALAELGFVVVVIDGSCNPDRSKSFHDACYANMVENTLNDQIAGLKELAAKNPYMDLTRVGVWGHSGGGYATAAAMFRFPDFYKVGISESGNHDNRNYEDDWGERYIGLMKYDANWKSNYEDQATQNFAKNLKGKLLLAHGGMDDNVPPYNTYLVVDALIKANKDFDLLILPNARHGYGGDSYYMMRRRWDYFVKNLLGVEPPKEYKIIPKPDPRMAQ
ncbi:MAG: DPP IV N-terminal domain-containing protein [Pyrinomonadaceae bacterium]|nr:DPP IV N-terminal domain-containing protein [Acidobacteriota bacterium]MBK7933342.1 DPP IV N-terminal domain-containing protein [Acidobacteriota bacterium]MBP7375301.1 DPP IV N-terminal domain-containing protein [Pyrinomonadaceae bacterium]